VGKITLSQWLGSKKIVVGRTHNSGGKPLFDFLTSCFTGDFSIAQAKLPRKIGIYTREDDTIRGLCKYPLISAAKKVESTSNASAVRYSFIIPYDVISSIESFEYAYIGLYPENPIDSENPYNDYLASFSLKDLNRSLFLNSALTVDWDLQIVNGSTEYDESTLSN
jgi:hypothetical protein